MKSNAQLFLDAFSEIEGVFKSWNKSSKAYSFSNYVHQYAKTHSVISQYRDDLLEYSQLRNAIVHDRAGNNEIIAQPHDEVVAEIQKIAEVITKPKLINEIEFGKLVTCQIHDDLESVLDLMNKKDYQQVPVLDGAIVVGLLTYQNIVAYMVKHIKNHSFSLTHVKIKDIKQEVDRTIYELMHNDRPIRDVIDAYESYQKNGRILSGIIILNENSKKHGPIGILTSKDIPKLLTKIEVM